MTGVEGSDLCAPPQAAPGYAESKRIYPEENVSEKCRRCIRQTLNQVTYRVGFLQEKLIPIFIKVKCVCWNDARQKYDSQAEQMDGFHLIIPK